MNCSFCKEEIEPDKKDPEKETCDTCEELWIKCDQMDKKSTCRFHNPMDRAH